MDASSRNEPVGGSSSRGLGLLGELRFLWTCARLLASVLLELLVGLMRLAFFLLGRKAQRAKVRELILRAGPSTPMILVLGWALGGALGGLASGCSAEGVQARRATRVAQPGTSFDKQVEEMRWSAEVLLSMDGSQESLENDLDEFSEGTSFRDAGEDTLKLIWDSHAQESLEDDFNALSDPEAGQLLETMELWGW